MRFPLLCLLAVGFLSQAMAAEPFFKKNDVIALVGGEDMVVASENGYLETLLIRALPDDHLRFRNLAWEGDTVFEQHRDLNFPSWEEQLDKIGATVVICQFGQMESLAGAEKLAAFVAAYKNLLVRFSAGGRRRIVVVTPHETESTPSEDRAALVTMRAMAGAYSGAVEGLAKDFGARCLRFSILTKPEVWKTRDGLHLNRVGHFVFAEDLRSSLTPRYSALDFDFEKGALRNSDDVSLDSLICAKNKLWFNYWRPQNWAFLFGDRTNQPSSRDWRDPSKRWFPAEREEFLPLIEAKEKEIDALAEKMK